MIGRHTNPLRAFSTSNFKLRHYPPGGSLAEGQGASYPVRSLASATSRSCGYDFPMIGPPGASKSMLAQRLPGLLPPLAPRPRNTTRHDGNPPASPGGGGPILSHVWGRHVGKQLRSAPCSPSISTLARVLARPASHGTWGLSTAAGKVSKRVARPAAASPAKPPEPAPPPARAEIPGTCKQGLTSPPADSRMPPSRISDCRRRTLARIRAV